MPWVGFRTLAAEPAQTARRWLRRGVVVLLPAVLPACHSLDPGVEQHYASPPSASAARMSLPPAPHMPRSSRDALALERHGARQPLKAAPLHSGVREGHREPGSRGVVATTVDAAHRELPPPAIEHLPARPCRVAVLGDSLSDVKSGGGGYLQVLQRTCPRCTIDNFAKGASMVVQMRRRFESTVAPVLDRYSHLIVFGGVNDVYSDETAGRTPERITRDLSAIYERARAAGTRVVAINVAPWGGFKRYFNKRRGEATLAVNTWLKEQEGAGRLDNVVDAYRALSCGVPERLCPHFERPFKDGIHFGPAGHEVLGRELVAEAFATCPADSARADAGVSVIAHEAILSGP